MEEGHNIPSQSQPHLSPRGTPIPTSPGDALESLPSPQSAPRSTPSSTPVPLRYHFAVYGACSFDSSANPSDNLVSGYLYCSQLVEETQTRLKIRGVTLLESGQSWSRRHLSVGAELLEVATPPSPLRALSPWVQPMSKVSCCTGGRHPPLCTHTGAGAARGILPWPRASRTCAPAKLCWTANPEQGITQPGPGGAQRTRTPLPPGAHAPNRPGPRAPTATLSAHVADPQPHPDRQ